MCEVAPQLVAHRVSRAASSAISADDRTIDQLSDWHLLLAHDPPTSREGIQRRTTVIALVPVLVITRRAALLLPRFATHSEPCNE